MGRSGYTDDYDEDIPGCLWRQAVHRATTGYRGQHLLRKLRDALDLMPVKRLIADAIKDPLTGEVCALGALDPNAPRYNGDDDWEEGHARELAKHFGIAHALAAEIVYMNDEANSWRSQEETPEARWIRMRAWVESQIVRDERDAVRDASGRPIAPPQPEPAIRPAGPHLGNCDAREPVK